MAPSSISSIRKRFKYDVYLSFMGLDTRGNFVDHLYHALQQHGILTYKDDGIILRGSMIGDELLRSIRDSKFIIIVFSKNYASSSWCLNELVEIMECHKTAEQTAYPVYFDVEPSEVRKQIGAVGEAFSKHSNNEAAGKWRRALQEAADLPGWELKYTADGHEARFINKIVEEILLESHSVNFSNNKNLIGMELRINDVLSSLEIGFDDVHMIGIKGMGGAGKTTLAKAIFDHMSFQFEGVSFVENVGEVSEASLSGLKRLQEQLLSDVLNEQITISSVSEGKTMIEKELGKRKVLVVLDDVDQVDQLEGLAGALNWFGKGSIIIITTRDEQVLHAHGVQPIHHASLLSDKEAISLFSWYAFGKYSPVQGYEQLSLEVARYVAGLPLTIKVLGSLLRGKHKLEWIDLLERLKTIPLQETLSKLELSYTNLDDDYKEIFLHVACFMKGWRISDAIRVLESCGYHARVGLRYLELKSLLTISNECLGMHGHIQEMGRNIVRRLHPHQPNLHSRLWIPEEITHILVNRLGTEATRHIQISELQLSPKDVMIGLGCLDELRCLLVESETADDDLSFDWTFDEVTQYLPNSLRFLRWGHYPFRSLPVTFQANNLVALEMPDSRITQLWEGGQRQVLNNLRFLDLSRSMLTTLDLGLTPRLEWLELKDCCNLVDLLTPVGCLKRLVHLNLIGCSSFDSFSFIKWLESLEVLSLSKLHLTAKSLPEVTFANMPGLAFTCFYSEEASSSISDGQKFVSLDLKHSTKLESVSGSICGLQHLRHLILSGCIPEVPPDIDQLTYLEKLDLVSTCIKCLPDSIYMLKHLKSLKLKNCDLLDKLPENLGQLERLEKLTLFSSSIRRLPDSICRLARLKSLKLKSCLHLEEVPEDLGQLECLEKLNLLSARLKRLPDSIYMLKHLKSLKLESCEFLERLPEDLGKLGCLEKLILTKCIKLEEIPNSICKMNSLQCFYLSFCVRVKKLPEELGRLKCLRELDVKGTGINHLPLSISLVEGLRIVGSLTVLKSSGFVSEIQTSKGETFCYIKAVNNTDTDGKQRFEFSSISQSTITSVASSSTSSLHKSFKYDVYLSFRGEDTRKSFVDHLYHALQQQGIHTYKDDGERIRGADIMKDELLEVIQDSKLYIIVFSKNYASSSWCLDELVNIMECQQTTKQTVLPVFYDVDPSEIRTPSWAVGESSAKLNKEEAAEKWKNALKEAGNLTGWDLRNRHEAEAINEILEHVSLKLQSDHLSNDENLLSMEPSNNEIPIGMEPHIENVLASLEDGFGDVGIIGIEGIGGVGKTSLARAIFDKISFQFEGISFVENVRDVSKASLSGLMSLQKQVLSDVLKERITIRSVYEGKVMIKKKLGHKNVLVVFDDVDNVDQLEALAGSPNWYGKGSIIIITTRDEQVLHAHGVQLIHHVNVLSDQEAICLLNQYAFGGDTPAQGYEQVSREVIRHAAGLPLMIKDLGSLLRGKKKVEWIDVLHILESRIPSEASSSTSTIHKSFKYDVFLSFCGQDTGMTFIDHLYDALVHQGIHTYKDDQRIKQGTNIGNEHIRSIQESKFFIIIFTKNYASSSWCLDELVKIMECHRTTAHTAYPVFYHDLEPSEVHSQVGVDGENDDNWRQALEEAVNLAGWNMRDTADGEAGFIEKIVEKIWLELRSINVYINSKIIGMGPEIDELLSFLGPGVGDVRMLGITGKSGVGKTTLARAIFDRFFVDFEGTSFVEDIRKVSKASVSGLKLLQKQVLSDVLVNKGITISSVSEGKNLIEKKLGDRKVLVVLDDVDQIKQLEALAGAPNWFGKGSIVIITTEDEQMLADHGVKKIHCVRPLSEDDALCLFSWFAFGGANPVEGYKQLSEKAVCCADGVPLAIKVLGSFLRGKSKYEWTDVLQRLKVISLDDGIKLINSMKVLELSYMSLADDHREIFLDVACFMKGMQENDAIRILESCGFSKNGLKILERKSLLTISNEGLLDVHDCIEKMGKNIVRRSHPDQPSLHSRLWIQEEIKNILANRQGTEAIRHIQLSELQLSPDIVLEGLGSMEELRCLILNSEADDDDFSCGWEFDEARKYLPNSLQVLRWAHYPVPSLPVTFQANNLVTLEMPDSRITQLWEGIERQALNNLRFLDLSRSMLTTLDLDLTPRLEWLELEDCRDLADIRMPVRSQLTRLVHLNLIGCSDFNSFLFIKRLESLQLLSLSKLHIKANSPQLLTSRNMPRLEFVCSYSEEEPSSKSVVSLNLQPCIKLESISGSICGLQHLRHLTLEGCIPEVPADIDQLTHLEKLNLVSSRITCLPDNICMLNQLKSLELNTSDVERLPEGLGRLQQLENLTLLSAKIRRLPDSICRLVRLKSLKLKSCSLLTRLPEALGQLQQLENLTLLSASIRRLPDSICRLKHLKSIKLKSCKHLEEVPENLGQLECLEKLNLLSARIKRLPNSICMLKRIKSLNLGFCGLLERLPPDLGNLGCLEKLTLEECMELEEIPNSICKMNNLKCLHLPFCIRVKELPEELGRLKSLRELNVKGTRISHIPLRMYLVEDLCIVGSRALLKSCGFAPKIQTSENGETFCYTTKGVSSSEMISRSSAGKRKIVTENYSVRKRQKNADRAASR